MDLFFHWLSSRGLLMRTFNVIIIPGLKKNSLWQIIAFDPHDSWKWCISQWCSGYHYCITSLNKSWAQILWRFKSYSWHVGDLLWRKSLTMVLAERLNTFHWSTITQKQFIIFIIIINDNADPLTFE